MNEGLTKLLNAGRVRELASLLLKAEHPAPSRRLIEPLLEQVRDWMEMHAI